MAKARVTFSDGTTATVEANSVAEIESAVLEYERQIKANSRPKPKQSNTDYAQRLGAEITSGMTFGFADELGAFGAALASYGDPRQESQSAFEGMGFGDRYRAIRDTARQRSNEFRAERPVTGLVANLGGGVAQGIAAAPTRIGQLLIEAPKAAGTALGALGGYGASESDSAIGTLADTAVGAGTGLALGALAQPTANIVGDAVTAPGRYSAAVAAGRPGRQVMKAIDADDLNVDQIAARLRKMPEGATVADVGGRNVRGLGETVYNMPGRGANIAKRLFESRRAGAPRRVEGLINEVLETKGRNFNAVADDLADHLKTTAKPLYDAAFRKPIRMTDTLRGLSGRLKQEGIWRAAERKMRLDGQVTGTGIRFWDYAKREIDDRIGEAVRAGRNNDVRILSDLKNTMIRELDDQIPEYGQARAVYSSGARLRDALEAGRQFMREDAEITAAQLSDYTPGELQMFRLGAARFLRDKMLARSDGGDVSKAWFNSPLNREKISALFSDRRQLARLFRGMRSESVMQGSQNEIAANSATARRAAGMLDSMTDPQTAADAVTGGPKAAVLNALRRWWLENASALRNEQTRTEIARIIFNGNPAEREALLRSIQTSAPMAPYQPGIANSMAREALPLASGGAGAGVSSLLSSPASARK